ncbi:MAG: STAS domain-containing protein [Gammaproteobacteria bacterium]|nr:STAS domain-containing protein [Gammaproteobacteria bacterium]
MAFSAEKKADFLVIEITEELTVFNITECYEFLMANIKDDDKKVIVDLSNVSEMDSSGFQLLIWLKRKHCKGKELTITANEDSALEEFNQRYQFDLNGDQRQAAG